MFVVLLKMKFYYYAVVGLTKLEPPLNCDAWPLAPIPAAAVPLVDDVLLKALDRAPPVALFSAAVTTDP